MAARTHTPGEGAPPALVDVPPAPGRDDLEEISRVLEPDAGEVVAIVSDVHPKSVLQRLRTAASANDGRPLAVHRTSLPLLATNALATLAAELAPQAESAAHLAGALADVEQQIVCVDVVSSVLTLSHPKPSIGQRLLSLVPGTRFLVESTGVRRASRDALVEVLERPGSGRRAAATVNGRVPRWASELLQPFAVPAEKGAARGELAEIIVWPADGADLAPGVLDAPTVPCAWCGTPTATCPCPSCGHDRQPLLVAEAAA